MSQPANWLAVVVVFGGLILGSIALRHLTVRRARAVKAKLNDFDYLVFEANASDLQNLQHDLTERGWKLASSVKSAGPLSLYRFEKEGGNSTNLGEIVMDFDKFMPRTSTRTTQTVIKIKEHGLRRS